MPIHGSYGHYAIDHTKSDLSDSSTYVFVYDTTKDSDGGAWRHRCQHTSWYNEASSANRSSRKEFPQVAIIAFDGNKLDILDADDPNCPLWMRFIRNGGSSRDVLYGCGSGAGQGGGLNGLRFHMLNGILVICSNDTNFWPVLIDFIKDDCIGLQTNAADKPIMLWGNTLVHRNTTSTDSNIYWSGDNKGRFINGWWIHELMYNNPACNDVDMRVLPGAPINPSTGIEIPTIMFAKGDNDVGSGSTTVGSVDIITHSGEVVVKQTNQNWQRFAKFISDDEIVGIRNAYVYVATADLSEESGQNHPSGWNNKATGSGTGYAFFRHDSGANWPAQHLDHEEDGQDGKETIACCATKDAYAVANDARGLGGCGNGVTIYAAPQNKQATYRRAAFIDRWSSSGWLYGKCIAALLCDSTITTPAANVGNDIPNYDIVTNGSFASNINGWTDMSGSGSSISWSSNDGGRIDMNGATAYARAMQALSCEVGQAYTVIVDPASAVFGANQEFQIYVGTGASGQSADIGYATWKKGLNDDNESLQVSFVAERTTVYVSLVSGWNVALLNCEVRRCSMDRSGYQDDSPTTQPEKARGIFWDGNLNFNPVDTGCELGAWSGFGSSDKFYQYWNTAHNSIGTNPMYVMCWIKGNSGMVWHKHEAGGNSQDARGEFNGSGNIVFTMQNDGNQLTFSSNRVIEGDKWTHVVWVKPNARDGQLFIDGEFDNGGTVGGDVSWDAGSSSRLGIGNRGDGINEAFNGAITLFKLGEGAPSADDIRQIYKDEKRLFVPGTKMSLGGDSGHVKAMDYDHSTDLLHVGTNFGTSAFDGIVRESYEAGAVTRSISAAAGIVAKV